jgi:hypothetical protein
VAGHKIESFLQFNCHFCKFELIVFRSHCAKETLQRGLISTNFSVQITFRETWIDGRLAYGLPGDNKPDFLILSAGQQIW